MTLSRSRLNKINENVNKSKFDLSQINIKIEEMKNAIKVNF